MMLKLSRNTALDFRIITYAYRHRGCRKDLMNLSKQLKLRSSEDFIHYLSHLEEEKFLISDPQIWRLTAKGEAAAIAIESSQKDYLYLRQ